MIKEFVEVWKHSIREGIEDFKFGLEQLESEIRNEILLFLQQLKEQNK